MNLTVEKEDQTGSAVQESEAVMCMKMVNDCVLVMGMKMPPNCMECYIREKYMCRITKKCVCINNRPKWCPLIEVYRHELPKREGE